MKHPRDTAGATAESCTAPLNVVARLADAPAGVIARDGLSLPAGADAALRLPVILPEWHQAVYHAPFQRHSINPALDLWPEGLNQCQPLPVDSLHEVKRGGLFLLLRLGAGRFLALLPLTGRDAMASFRGNGTGLVLEVSHFGSEPLIADLPLLAYASSKNPYAACRLVWETALAHPAMVGVGGLRTGKPKAPDFEYLGWCSFEEYKLAINEENMCEALRLLADSAVPVRWALIDDGHVEDGHDGLIETQEGDAPAQANDPSTRRVRAAGTHRGRFPRGWAPLLETIRGTKIRRLGIWLNFNGYWGGVDPAGDWPAEVRDHLVRLDEHTALPGPSPIETARFWAHLLAPAKEAGVGLLKVDNQANNLRLYAGRVPNAVAASAANKQALEAAACRHFGAQLINCMAHNGVATFHTPVSGVIRCSEDYKKGDPWRAKHHLHNSFGNMLWLGAIAWGDHDMFHSSDPTAAGALARSKALSGGPVYLSDHPDRFRLEYILPLCLGDGRLLRPLAPAMPLPDGIFQDPYESPAVYRVGAPLPHGCAAIGCYNLAHPDRMVSGTVSAGDHATVRDMLGANEQAADEIVVFDQRGGRAWLSGAAHALKLPPGGDALFILSPVRHGWALLGAPEKFLAPAFVQEFDAQEWTCTLSVPEPGRVWIWSRRRVVADSLAVRAVAECVWEVEFTAGRLHGAVRDADRPSV